LHKMSQIRLEDQETAIKSKADPASTNITQDIVQARGGGSMANSR